MIGVSFDFDVLTPRTENKLFSRILDLAEAQLQVTIACSWRGKLILCSTSLSPYTAYAR